MGQIFGLHGKLLPPGHYITVTTCVHRGYTICPVRGEGMHGLRASQWEGGNIKVEVIVDHHLADAIGEHVAKSYFPNFAVILYLLPVQVLREEKFTHPENPSGI